MAPVSDTEILILDCFAGNIYAGIVLNTAQISHSFLNRTEKFIECRLVEQQEFSFYASENQARMAGTDKLVALVENLEINGKKCI